ncbi:MAG: Ni/Fe hydrogenase [Rhodoferax sp.]|nr:Ni/Fe hydrogenase [Rhodoferax sp.]
MLLLRRSHAGWLALALVLVTPLAQAHSETGAVGGFISGFVHPISGWDHIAAMVAVGIWGAFLGSPAMWLLPVIFPLVMAVGGALGVLGVPIMGVETGIALSGVVLGGMIVFAARPPLWFAGLLVAIFAIFHGYAHGVELPQAANAVTYAVGFVIATGLLHLCGIGIGWLIRWDWGRLAVRATGGVIAATGFAFLLGYL